MTAQATVGLYTADQARALDREAMSLDHVSAQTLMIHAGEAAFKLLLERWPHARRIHVVCGTGNNGGDGWVVARLAREAGIDVAVERVGAESRIHGAARQAMYDYLAAGGDFRELDGDNPCAPGQACVVVDAVLGTGFSGELRAEQRHVIETMNASGRPVLAIDCPSGLHPDTGMAAPVAVRATTTITFIGRNQGLYTGEARDYTGDVVFEDLDVPATVYATVPPAAELLVWQQLLATLPPRRHSSHKGSHGHVLVIGGNVGFSGAAVMCAESALLCGSGLVSLASTEATVAACLSRRPEVMARTVTEQRDVAEMLRRASTVVIGPGLGTDAWAADCLGAVLDSGKPTVFDADALNVLASAGLSLPEGGNYVVTPHPGEASRLLGVGCGAVRRDRFAAARQLQSQLGAVVVLKGAGTLVADGCRTPDIAVCAEGGPVLATGGTGDVLAGCIAALMAQGLSGGDAARLGVCAHARAADHWAARYGERGLPASELGSGMRGLLNGML